MLVFALICLTPITAVQVYVFFSWGHQWKEMPLYENLLTVNEIFNI